MNLPKSKKGFTLVEAVIAITLLVIIIAVTTTIILSSMNLYANTATQDEARSLGNYVYNYYFNQLCCAKDLELVSDNNGYPKAIAIADGRLQFRKAAGEAFNEVFSEDFYHGCSLHVKTSVTAYLLTLSVSVLQNEKILYTKESAFKLINPAGGKGFLSGTLTAVENPTIYYQE
ncbi:MAG: prepilin-type N-terminal cleavage/methylation domain-containing protein [Clostridia bacterium]|nr:prepilin-type N-terminal cleavage/methylation domain-containing protein [Clostridia bacterium]